MSTEEQTEKHLPTINLLGATGIGIGAMVGGGILALAGVAFSVSGPSAILAFLLNGIIALVTALSFAEMASAHPQSGGTYTFAKKAMSIHVAFGVGWIVWFASLVAAVLYALGFGSFAAFIIRQLATDAQPWLTDGTWLETSLAMIALLGYGFSLSRKSGSGGALANIGKMSVFVVLIAAGLYFMVNEPISNLKQDLQPFFSNGFSGLLTAMGYTFIALQGFDLIASASSEIKDAPKTIPKAMVSTVLIGLIVYIPLLFVVSTVGLSEGGNVADMAAEYPETFVAIAARNFMGEFGFWLVLVAGVFSMLSALQANVFAASRMALSMASDGHLLPSFASLHPIKGTPVKAVWASVGIIAILAIALPNVAAAGAASSLIFLLSFTLAHLIMILLRRRSSGFEEPEEHNIFRVPLFPYLPIAGMVACIALAIFQAIAEPAAGVITLLWLVVGSVLFVLFFLQKAQVYDASDQALNPELVRLRGKSPLVLLPVSNPDNADSLFFVAQALTPSSVSKVLLLSILTRTDDEKLLEHRLEHNQRALMSAFRTALLSNQKPDALTTVAPDPWDEIERVAITRQCEALVLGLSSFSQLHTNNRLELLVSHLACDVVVVRQPHKGWKITEVKKVLVPVGGLSAHDALRARLAASLWRASKPEFIFLQVVPQPLSVKEMEKRLQRLRSFAARIIPGKSSCEIKVAEDINGTLIQESEQADLVILGLGKVGPEQQAFGPVALELAQKTQKALVFIRNK